MAAPNIVNVAQITAKHVSFALSTTGATVIASNAASSNTVVKVNNLVISNVTATLATATISVHSLAAGGGTAFRLAYQVGIAPNASLVVIDKPTGIYLEEDRSVTVTAGTANALEVNCSYEILS